MLLAVPRIIDMGNPRILLACILLVACGVSDDSASNGPRQEPTRTDLSTEFYAASSGMAYATMAEGLTYLVVGVRGSGTLTITFSIDGNENLEREFSYGGGDTHTETVQLPGDGLRGVDFQVKLTGNLSPLSCSLQSMLPETTEADASLLGCLEGRNVIVFVEDSLAAKHLSAYGYERDTSPYLEQVAAAGVRFASAYSQTSWTLSSVTSLFTSLEQERHGVLMMNERLGDEFTTLAELFSNRGYRTVGLLQNGVLWSQTGLDRGFDEYKMYDGMLEGTQQLLARARDLALDDNPRPIFLYVHLTPPHQPYTPPGEFMTRYADPDYAGEVDGSIISCATLNHQKPAEDSPDVQHLAALYDGHIRFIDERVGQLIKELKKAGCLDEFLIVKSSDHGEAFFEHGVQGHNSTVYEEMVRIPLVMHASGSPLPSGFVVDQPVSLMDLLPTLSDLFGLESSKQAINGRSLLPYLQPKEQLATRPLYYTSRRRKGTDKLQAAVRMGRFKFVRRPVGSELFDISADSDERIDISNEHPVTAHALDSMLKRWYTEAVASGTKSAEVEIDEQRLQAIQNLGYAGDIEDEDEPR
ncbi:MAG: arylsulfatase A-like enzyme [Planctomycetota bacterium]